MNEIIESPYQYKQDRQLYFIARSPYNNMGFLKNIKKSLKNPLIYRNQSKDESLADNDNTLESIQKHHIEQEYSVQIERSHHQNPDYSSNTARSCDAKVRLPAIPKIKLMKKIPQPIVQNPQDCTEEIPNRVSRARLPKIVIEPAKPIKRKVRLQQLMQQNVSEQMKELEKILLKFDKPKRHIQVKKVSFQDEPSIL